MRLIRNRNFIFLWLSHAMATIGDVLFNIGVMFTIYENTNSTLQTMGVMIATTLPTFLFGPIAGVGVDRYSRKKVMLSMDGARALFLILLLLSIWHWGFHSSLAYAVVFINAIARTFSKPAQLAIIPDLVSKQHLAQANSVMMSTTYAAMAFAYGLGGGLVLWLGLLPIISLDALAYVISALFLLGLSLSTVIKPESDTPSTDGFIASIRIGWQYIKQHQTVRPLLVMEIVEHIPHGIWTSALLLAFVERALNGDAIWWGWQNGAFFMGMLFGALLGALVAKSLSPFLGWVIIVNAFLFSAQTLVFALSPSLLFSVIVAFLFGPSQTFRDLAQDTLLQSIVDSRVLGRVLAARDMGTHVVFMIAAPFFALGADFISPRWIYMFGAFIYLLTASYALSRSKIRKSGLARQA